MTPELEEKLVSEARLGNRSAFEELARLTWRLVYAHHVLETGDRHRAEDLTQETLLSAMRSLGQLRSARGFRSWVLNIARNAATDAARRSSTLRRGGALRAAGSASAALTPALADLPTSQPTPAQSAEDAEQRRAALAALRELPEEYRVPLTLRLLVGADHATICQQLDLSDGALRGLLHRGMKLLREQFATSKPSPVKPISLRPAEPEPTPDTPAATVPSSGA